MGLGTKLKIAKLLGEMLDEITSWFSFKQVVIFLLVAGLLVAVLGPVIAGLL